MASPPKGTGPQAPGASRLGVLVDGEPLPDDDARAFWGRFSAYMEEHKGDLGGFAAAEGFASVHPQMGAGGAVLVASRSASQRPYTNVSSSAGEAPLPGGSRGGSRAPQGRPAQGDGGRPQPRKSAGKRR